MRISDWSSDVCSSDLAADLVSRKLGLEGGAVLEALLADIRVKAVGETTLFRLAASVEEVARHLLSEAASVDDRLAASTPFLRMLSVLVCGWLMAAQGAAAGRRLSGGADDPALDREGVG